MFIPPELVVIGVLVVGLALMLSNRLRPDIVALLVMLTLRFSEVVTTQEALAGFSSSAVITIMGLFVLTHALEATGVVQWMAQQIRALSGGAETRLVLIFMTSGALLSLLMNNIAAGAVLLPAAVQVGREAGVRASKLLMPLAFGTLVGGMATLFTTANIILSSILRQQTGEGLGMLDFVPVGGLIVLASLAYMAVIGRHLLPDRETNGGSLSPQVLSRELSTAYALDERLWEVRVPAGAQLEGVALCDSGIGEKLGVSVIAIWREHHALLAPEPTEIIEANDYLLVLGREERVRNLEEWGAVVGRENGGIDHNHDYTVDLTEVVVPPRSSVIGKTLKDLRFRNHYGLTSVALWRSGRSYRTDVGLFPLQAGDALLMVGPTAKIKKLVATTGRNFIVVTSSHVYQPPHPNKAIWAVSITLLVLLLSILEIIPVAEAMLAGAVGVVLAGCLTMDEAYDGIEWRVVFLIAGMLPLSAALVKTGLAGLVSSVIVNQLAPYGELALIAGMSIITILLCQVIAGQVTALIIGPIAVTAAMQMGIDARAMAVAVSIACSAAFLTPLGHPVNILMMGPGGYLPSDFTRVGIGMTIVVTTALLVGMALFWGIR